MQDAIISTLLELPEALYDAVASYTESTGKDFDEVVKHWIALGLLQSLPQCDETKTDRQTASKIYLEGVFNSSH